MSEVSLYIIDVYPADSSVVSVIVTLIHVLAIWVTCLRLYHRYKISRLWWDDCVAAVAGIVDCVAVIDVWVGDARSSEEDQ